MARDEVTISLKRLAERVASLARTVERRKLDPSVVDAVRYAGDVLDVAGERLVRPETPLPTFRTSAPPQRTAHAVAEQMSRVLRSAGPRGSGQTGGNENGEGRSAAQVKNPGTEATGAHLIFGSTSMMNVPEVLEFLAMLRKSGDLEIKSPVETVTIAIREGYVVHALSDHSPVGLRLGEILVEREAITEERLEQALMQVTNGRPLGATLEQIGAISREDLTGALEHQVQHLFQRLTALEEASFSFTETTADTQEQRIHLSLEYLLLEGSRRDDESKKDSLPVE